MHTILHNTIQIPSGLGSGLEDKTLGLIHSDPHFEIHPSIQEYIKKTFMCMGNHSPPKIT